MEPVGPENWKRNVNRYVVGGSEQAMVFMEKHLVVVAWSYCCWLLTASQTILATKILVTVGSNGGSLDQQR
jgi:hypothetical protein